MQSESTYIYPRIWTGQLDRKVATKGGKWLEESRAAAAAERRDRRMNWAVVVLAISATGHRKLTHPKPALVSADSGSS